jgi:integrase
VPNGIRHRERRLQHGEFEKLERAAIVCRNIYLWPAIQFAIHTAMRRSEILSLGWEDIDFMERFAKLRDTKNGSSRIIPLSFPAIEILKSLPHSGQRVFVTTDYAIRHSWDRLVKRAKLEDLKFHDLRHEAISRFFEMGLNIAEVSLVSGHSDLRMLLRYTHPKIRLTLDKIDSKTSERV